MELTENDTTMLQATKLEQRRLASDEGDWNLTRGVVTKSARGSGNSRPDYDRMAPKRLGSEDTDFKETSTTCSTTGNDDDAAEDEGSVVDEMTTTDTSPPTTKPSNTRVILKVSQLKQAFLEVPLS